MIQALHREGKSLRAIAEIVGCAHATVYYELKRGTPPRGSNRGKVPQYSDRRGQAVYRENRRRSRRPCKLDNPDCEAFVQWMAGQVRKEKWSIDICAGYAREHHLFPEEQMPCTKTLCNMLHKGKLPISLFDVPRALKWKQRRKWVRKNKRMKGRGIDERPAIVGTGTETGHWELDTVVGRRAVKEVVVFTAVEKATRHCIAIKIPVRNSASVEMAMEQMKEEYGREHFKDVFKTMTADNGAEFDTLSKIEEMGTMVYFTHPCSSWERAQNERHNGLLREYIPKGVSIESFSDDDVLSMADEINDRPRRILGYKTSAELFGAFLDRIYAA